MLGLVAVLTIVAVIFLIGGDVAGRTEAVFTAYFRGVRPDPWPHGVQEEDRSERWGAREGAGPQEHVRDAGPEQEELVAGSVMTAPVRAVVGRTGPRS